MQIRTINVANNQLVHCDAFSDPRGPGGIARLVVNCSNNNLNSSAILDALTDYTTGAGVLTKTNAPVTSDLTLDFSGNNCTELPDYFLHVAGLTGQYNNRLALIMARNPIKYVSARMFQTAFGRYSPALIGLSDLYISIAHPTAGAIEFPEQFNFTNVFSTSHTLTFDATHTGTSINFVSAFKSFLPTGGAGCNLTLILADNNISEIGPHALVDAVTVLDLSDNLITWISDDAFGYTFDLKSLLLSRNKLTVLNSELLDSTPALARLLIDSNNILAIPSTSNHLLDPSFFANNPLRCRVSGPRAANCSCVDVNYTLSEHCGYVRCTPTLTGCPAGQLDNSSNCSLGPWSACVDSRQVEGIEYYDAALGAFLPVTQCRTAYPDGNHTSYLPSWQYSSYTTTSDRRCAICSTCPSWYETTPCTATSDAQCLKSMALSATTIAVAALGTVLFSLITAGLVLWWSRAQIREAQNQPTDFAAVREMLMREIGGDHQLDVGPDEMGFALAIVDLAGIQMFGDRPVMLTKDKHGLLQMLARVLSQDRSLEVDWKHAVVHVTNYEAVANIVDVAVVVKRPASDYATDVADRILHEIVRAIPAGRLHFDGDDTSSARVSCASLIVPKLVPREIDRRSVLRLDMIGKGSAAAVFKAQVRDSTGRTPSYTVAIKVRTQSRVASPPN